MPARQIVPLVPPRECTPKLTHVPALKWVCSNALAPESPAHVALADRNAAAVIADPPDERQLGKAGSLGMQSRMTFCLIRRMPAVVPAVSVGSLRPYPTTVTFVE